MSWANTSAAECFALPLVEQQVECSSQQLNVSDPPRCAAMRRNPAHKPSFHRRGSQAGITTACRRHQPTDLNRLCHTCLQHL